MSGTWASYVAGFSPYALKSAYTETAPSEALRLRWIRIFWWLLLLFIYSFLLLQSNTNRELSSGLHFAIMEQLFPDWNKASERTRDGEVSPDLKEIMDAEEVAAILAFYNDICARDASIHSSIKDAWECKLFDIRVEHLQGGDWDPTTNRALPDMDKDAEMTGKRGIMEAAAGKSKTNQELTRQRRQEVTEICSEKFFSTHFVIGDDPRQVPVGDAKAFSRKVDEVHPGLDPVYDEDQLHNRGMGRMMRIMDDLKAAVDDLKEKEHMTRRHRSPRSLDVDQEEPDPGSQSNASQEPLLGSGCFDSEDVAGLLRDLWSRHAGASGNMGWGLTEPKAKALAFEALPNMTQENWLPVWHEMNPDGDEKLSGEEFLEFAERHLLDFQWPIRGYLNSECRNHHFRLLSLCKPQSLSVLYQIAFMDVQNESSTALQRIAVKLSFSQVAPNSGWYRAKVRVYNRGVVGRKSPATLYVAILTLILFSLLTLLDSFISLVLLPMNTWRLVRLELPSEASFEEVGTAFWKQLLQLLDGRGVLSLSTPAMIIMMERLVALGFLFSCLGAAREALQATMLPMGGLDERCALAWFEGNKEWIVGENVPRGIDMYTFLHECTGLRGTVLYTELLYQSLFEDEGSRHALVAGLIMIRVLESFSLSPRLNWLPRTLYLAKTKLQNFLIAYLCLVAGFSLLMTLYFGDMFQQYSTLCASVCTLLLFSFGDTNRALLGAQPFIEVASSHLQAVLFFYTVFVVTIILNMFTTIVIDAFSAEADPERYERVYQEEMHGLTLHLLHLFGKGHLASKSIRKESSHSKDAKD